MGCLLDDLRGYSCFNFYLDLLLDLNYDVAIDCLSMVNWLVFVQLQNNRNLRFVHHRQDEAFSYILVLDDVVESAAMEPESLVVEVDGVLSSRRHQVYVVKGSDRFTPEVTDLSQSYYLLVCILSVAHLDLLLLLAFPLDIFLLLLFLTLNFHLVLILR